MNTKLISSVLGILAFATVTTVHAGGTDILHLSLQETMSNSGVETNATGNVALTQNVQGKADKQFLSMQVTGLTSNSTYILFAGILDTNLTEVTNFVTDDNGNATLQYGTPGKGKNKNNTPLPDALNPLRNVRAVAVGTIVTNLLSVDTNIVLSADLSAATQFQYLVKRDISTNSAPVITNAVPASIRIKASNTQAQFQLTASHLLATADYIFAVNDAFAETVTSDAKGRLKLTVNPDPSQILSVSSVALWDNASNVVLRTTLP